MNSKQTKRAKPQGRCIFCNGTGLSKEHIWSDWLTPLFPRTDEHGEYWGHIHRESGQNRVEPAGCSDRQGSVLQRKLRIVCERCNNGWMSRVVDRAKPHVERMIKGTSFHLDRAEQTEVAAWIGITTVIQEFANRRGARKIPQEDRTFLMNTVAPPPSWSIWIANYSGEWWAPMHHYHCPASYSKPPTDGEPNPSSGELQLTTFTLGKLLVHVFTSTQSEMVEVYRSYIGSASKADKLPQLWPIAGETLNWPPSSSFRDSETDCLAFDWIERNWGVHGLPGRPQERNILRLVELLKSEVEAGNLK